jgi:hypothetical protein
VAAVQRYARNLDSSGVMLKAMAIGYVTDKTHAQKKRCPVAIGFFSSRRRRCSCGRNVQRRSPSRIACKADGSGNGTDSRWVDFDD